MSNARTLFPLFYRLLIIYSNFYFPNQDSVSQSYNLAEFHAQKAVDALMRLPDTEYRKALMRLLHVVLSRDK